MPFITLDDGTRVELTVAELVEYQKHLAPSPPSAKARPQATPTRRKPRRPMLGQRQLEVLNILREWDGPLTVQEIVDLLPEKEAFINPRNHVLGVVESLCNKHKLIIIWDKSLDRDYVIELTRAGRKAEITSVYRPRPDWLFEDQA